ncbi:MAG: DUF1707 domain-containing protein [Propionibacterium sp.]|nr:DUF1707 domain-containing protein [Propionibacterium sp.]
MSEIERRRRMRASDEERDAVLRIVQEAYAAGRLDIEEAEERQDRVLGARYTDELGGIVDDLPEGQHIVGRPHSPTPATAPRGHVPTRFDEERKFSFAVLSGRDLTLAPGSPGMRDFAWWGGHNIYLRDAMGPGAVVVLELHAIMGGHDIYVPPGVRIVDESTAIMAGNDIDQAAQGDGSNGTLILRGFLWWAGSDVKLDTRGLQPGHPDHGRHY